MNKSRLHTLLFLIGLGLLLPGSPAACLSSPYCRGHVAGEHPAASRRPEALQQAEAPLPQGADLNARDKNGNTPLYLALENHHPETARALILQGADVNAKAGYHDSTPLLSALADSKIPPDIIPLLLKHGADVDAADSYGATPLIRACSTAPLATVRLLIRNGAKVNVAGEHGETPLMAATRNPDVGVVRLLLDHKADVHARNSEEATALIVAASYYQAQPGIIRLLLAHKADIEARDKYGDTPLIAACRYAPAPVARLLIERRADVNVQEPFHETALFLVVLTSWGPKGS